MKKTTLGFLLWLVAGFFMVAFASLPVDGYFHLKVVRIGQQVDTAYLAVYPDKPDSLVLLENNELLAKVDNLEHSLWSFTVKEAATGQNAYEIVNKQGAKFAFNEPSGPIEGNDPADANEAVALLRTDGALNLWNDILVTADTFSLQSYIDGVKYQLSLLGKDRITIAGTAGNKNSEYLFFTIEKPKERWMTADELNAKSGDGFKLFFYYQGSELTSELAPAFLNGMKLIADTTHTFFNNDSIFFLQLADDPASEKKCLFVDTTSYLTDTTQLINGGKLNLIYGKKPTTFSAYSKPGIFSFRTDPGSFKDSVAIFVHGSYGWNGTAKKWDYKPAPSPVPVIKDLIPVQLNLSGNIYYLVTSDAKTADSRTHITFNEFAFPSKLKKGSIYSVKVVNKGVNNGKYWVASWRGERDYASAVYDDLPYTQFIYEDNMLVSRDAKTLTTLPLFKISETDDIYTNSNRDTFEIKEMKKADKHSHTLSFNYLTDAQLKEVFMIDIESGGFAGKVIGVSTDSVVSISDNDLKYFKVVPAYDIHNYGGASHYVTEDGQDSICEQKRQSYYFKSIEKDEYIYVDTVTSRLMLTTKNRTPFYMRKTPVQQEYILIYENSVAQLINQDSLKVQVNSQSGSLELVDMKVTDNYFRVYSDADIAVYKKDAEGYYEFTSYSGLKLTKNAANYAVFRNEGDPVLKSGIYGENDFKLYVEPALTTGAYKRKPSYYIVKDAETGADKREISGYFLHVLDSGKVADPTPYQVEIGGVYFNRLSFVKGKRFSGDSILVNYELPSQTLADSIGYKGKNEKGIKEYRFFLRETDVKDEYLLVSEFGFDGQGNEDGYLSSLNDVLFISPRSSASTIRVTQTDPPLSNDDITVDNEIRVVSEKGAVTILNAAGKEISIMNILGKMIKKHTVSSDQERIELPQGIVIINVAGERAIKSIVK